MEKIYERVFSEGRWATAGIMLPLSTTYENKIKDIIEKYEDTGTAEEFAKEVVDILKDNGLDNAYHNIKNNKEVYIVDFSTKHNSNAIATAEDMQLFEDTVKKLSSKYPNNPYKFFWHSCIIYTDGIVGMDILDKSDEFLANSVNRGLTDLYNYSGSPKSKEAALEILSIISDIKTTINTVIDNMFSDSINPIKDVSVARDNDGELFIRFLVSAKRKKGDPTIYQENKTKIDELEQVLAKEF